MGGRGVLLGPAALGKMTEWVGWRDLKAHPVPPQGTFHYPRTSTLIHADRKLHPCFSMNPGCVSLCVFHLN